MNSLAATLFLRLLAIGNAEYGDSSSSVRKSPDNGTVGLIELRHYTKNRRNMVKRRKYLLGVGTSIQLDEGYRHINFNCVDSN